jgi:hypothetical protein
MLVIAYAVFALMAVSVAALRGPGFKKLSLNDRWVAAGVVLLVAWPLMCSFFVGPLFWSTAEAAGVIFPLLWYFPAMVVAVGIFTANILDVDCTVDIPAALLMTLFPLSLISLLWEDIESTDLIRCAVAFILFSMVVLKRKPVTLEALAWACRASLFLVCLSVLAAILVNSGRVVDTCRVDKCGSAGQVLTSPFAGNGNILGLSLVLILPFALAGLGIIESAFLIAGVMALAELAGSRTAFIGFAVAIAMVVALRTFSDPVNRSRVLRLGVLLAAVLSLVPVAFSFTDAEFTFRGYLWNQAKSMIADNLILGEGPMAWTLFGRSSINEANYSPHNGWLDTILAVGLWGGLVIAVTAALKFRFARGQEKDYLLVYFAVVLAMSTLESVYVPYFLGIIPFAAVLPFVIGPGTSRTDHEEKRATEIQRTSQKKGHRHERTT